mgnify:FL=1
MSFISKIASLALVVVTSLVLALPATGSQSLDADVEMLKVKNLKLEKALLLEREKVRVLRMHRRHLIKLKAVETTCGTNDCDGDGFKTNKDCDDNNFYINPDAIEVAGTPLPPEDENYVPNYVDENCDGELADQDGDGVNYYDVPPDCDDFDYYTNPYAIEIPDDLADNDCDGVID